MILILKKCLTDWANREGASVGLGFRFLGARVWGVFLYRVTQKLLSIKLYRINHVFFWILGGSSYVFFRKKNQEYSWVIRSYRHSLGNPFVLPHRLRRHVIPSRVEVPEQISAEQRCFRDFKNFSANQRCFRMG